MNVRRLLAGLKIILTSNPIDWLKEWAKDDSEQGRAVRYALYIVNFAGANLGVIILLASAYIWFTYIVPNGCNITSRGLNLTFNMS